MLNTFKGIFRNGRIDLDVAPADAEGFRVLVTFLPPEQAKPAGQMMTYGMFADPKRKQSSREDFQEAKQALHKKGSDDLPR